MDYSLYDYNINIFRHERDGDFGACIDEIPEVAAFAPTPEQAMNELEMEYNGWLQVSREHGDVIPVPYRYRNYSGKMLVRMPKSLHQALVEQADKDHTSINQEILYCLTTGLERNKAHYYNKKYSG